MMKTAGSLFTIALAALALAASPPLMAQDAATTAGKSTKAAAKRAPAKPQLSGGGTPTLLGQFGEWGAYWAMAGDGKVCFAIARPVSSKTTPANRPRNQVFFFVASRPAENVRNEVSIIAGYPYKPGSDASIEVGTAKFAMNTQSDGAWIKNVAEEAQLVEIMRKGSDFVVAGTSSHGTQSVDRFLLKGLSQALDRAGQECGK